MIGDRLDTDIEGAASLGWDSVLVLTGVTRRDDGSDLERHPPADVLRRPAGVVRDRSEEPDGSRDARPNPPNGTRFRRKDGGCRGDPVASKPTGGPSSRKSASTSRQHRNPPPAKAQQLAKQLLEPGARKEQVAKAAQELLEWSQRQSRDADSGEGGP